MFLFAFAAEAAGPIEACVNPGNGNLRLVERPRPPLPLERTRISLNSERPCWSPPARPVLRSRGIRVLPGPPGASAGGPPSSGSARRRTTSPGGNTNATLSVFNGSASTANVAVHFLNRDGANLFGVAVPGATPPMVGDPVPTYPGQTGAATVPLLAEHTLFVKWITAQGDPAAGGNIPATVRVVSDQPIAVGSNIEFSGFHPVPCSLLPK